MLEGSDLALAIGTAAASLLWLLAAGVLYLLRKPPEPAVGPRTLELGPEPPAVASFLVNDFRVPSEAVPATLLDLAARGSWRSSSEARASSTSACDPRTTRRSRRMSCGCSSTCAGSRWTASSRARR